MNVSIENIATLFQDIKTVLLDMDGTLIDSNLAHARAWSDAIKSVGHDKSPEQLLPLIGMGADRILPLTIGETHTSEKGRQLAAAATEIFRRRYLPHVQAFPGTRRLCEALASRFKIVIASSADGEILKQLIRTAEIDDLITDETSSDDVRQSKPDTDVLVAALQRAGCEAAESLFVGDTPYDQEASISARIRFVGFRCGGWDDGAFRGATLVCDGPAQFADIVATAPPSRRA